VNNNQIKFPLQLNLEQRISQLLQEKASLSLEEVRLLHFLTINKFSPFLCTGIGQMPFVITSQWLFLQWLTLRKKKEKKGECLTQ